MRNFLPAVIAASILILPSVSFAMQADGPRAAERVAQQNDNYEKSHSQQPTNAGGEQKAVPSSNVDKSGYGFTSNGNSRQSGALRISPARNKSLYSHH